MRKLLCACLLATACTASGPPAQPPADSPATVASGQVSATSHQLTEIMDAVWERQLEQSLFLRMKLGYPIDHLPRLTMAQARADALFARRQLQFLDQLDSAALDHDQQLSLGLVRWQLKLQRQGLKFYRLTSPITPYASPLPTVHRVFTSFHFANSEDLERYERLLADYSRLLGEIQAHLELQLRTQVVLPAPELELVIPFLQSFHQHGAESLFYVDTPRLQEIDPAEASAFQQRILETIDRRVNRDLLNLLFFLANQYEHHAPPTLGLAQYPRGSEYYDFLVHANTTLDLTAEEIHHRGLAEVERLEKAMAKLRSSLGHPGAKSAFHSMLSVNQRYVAHSSEEIGERLQSYVALIEPRIGELFGRRPQAPYGVKPLPAGLAGAMTYGYYQSPSEGEPRGYYHFNGSQPEKRSLLWAQSLIYHELIPGHHFQLALQYENGAAHPLRRYNATGVFIEGWAEYASELGKELGLYKELDLYGRYLAEMLLSCRLVVDTGIHHFGWSRQQAIEYLQEHTMEAEGQIATEVLRYGIDIPAQALTYKIGAMKIAELRAKAEAELGERFDLRRFHDSLLSIGSLPLNLVADHVDWFIAQEQSR